MSVAKRRLGVSTPSIHVCDALSDRYLHIADKIPVTHPLRPQSSAHSILQNRPPPSYPSPLSSTISLTDEKNTQPTYHPTQPSSPYAYSQLHSPPLSPPSSTLLYAIPETFYHNRHPDQKTKTKFPPLLQHLQPGITTNPPPKPPRHAAPEPCWRKLSTKV